LELSKAPRRRMAVSAALANDPVIQAAGVGTGSTCISSTSGDTKAALNPSFAPVNGFTLSRQNSWLARGKAESQRDPFFFLGALELAFADDVNVALGLCRCETVCAVKAAVVFKPCHTSAQN
jgi:hypothetical protein